MKKFYEVDVTNYSQAHLKFLLSVLTIKDCGWKKHIDDLEMVLIDDRIIIRGWATKFMWSKFYKTVIEDTTFDFLYQ